MDITEACDLLALAERVDEHVLGDDGSDWASRLDERADQLPGAAETLIAAGEPRAALALVAALSRWAQASGRVDEVRALADDVLGSLGSAAPTVELAGALLVQGELAFRQADQATAAAATRAALTAAQVAGDTAIEARAEMNLARVAFRDGDAPRIFEHAERMLALAGDDPRAKSGAVHMLGWAEYTSGNLAGAIGRFEKNVELYRQAGNLAGVAAELANLGDLAAEAGDLDRARQFLRESFDLAVERKDRYLLPGLLASIAALAGLSGRAAEMLELAAAAERQYEAAGLAPDPGDGVGDELRAAARAEMGGERADALAARGREHTLETAIGLARSLLA